MWALRLPPKPIPAQRLLFAINPLSLANPEYSEIQESLILWALLSHWRNTTKLWLFKKISSPLPGWHKFSLFKISPSAKRNRRNADLGLWRESYRWQKKCLYVGIIISTLETNVCHMGGFYGPQVVIILFLRDKNTVDYNGQRSIYWSLGME